MKMPHRIPTNKFVVGTAITRSQIIGGSHVFLHEGGLQLAFKLPDVTSVRMNDARSRIAVLSF